MLVTAGVQGPFPMSPDSNLLDTNEYPIIQFKSDSKVCINFMGEALTSEPATRAVCVQDIHISVQLGQLCLEYDLFSPNLTLEFNLL